MLGTWTKIPLKIIINPYNAVKKLHLIAHKSLIGKLNIVKQRGDLDLQALGALFKTLEDKIDCFQDPKS